MKKTKLDKDLNNKSKNTLKTKNKKIKNKNNTTKAKSFSFRQGENYDQTTIHKYRLVDLTKISTGYKLILDMKFTIAIALLFLIISLFYVSYDVIIITGESMEPTYQMGERLIVNKNYTQPKKDDVVWIKIKNKYYIKRIAAMPGDEVKQNENGLFINNEKINDIDVGENSEYTLKADEYYVLGDNQDVSYDSRFYGPIKYDQINGYIKEKQNSQENTSEIKSEKEENNKDDK